MVELELEAGRDGVLLRPRDANEQGGKSEALKELAAVAWQLLEQSKQVATQWQAQVTRCWQSAAAAGADEQRYESPSRASPNRGEYAFGSREPRRRILGRSPPLSP